MGLITNLKARWTKPPKNLQKIGNLPIAHILDKWRRQRMPNATELLEMFTEVVYFCANFNANALASAKFKLYVPGKPKKSMDRFGGKSVPRHTIDWMNSQPCQRKFIEGRELTELTDHPVLTLLFESPSAYFEGFDLIYLAQLYREVVGRSIWQLELKGVKGLPSALWPIPSHKAEPALSDTEIMTGYKIHGSDTVVPMDQLVVMRTPHLESPYTKCWSPTLAAARSAGLLDLDLGLAFSFMTNRARPDVWISPKEVGALGPDEAHRLHQSVRKIYSHGGDGGVLISDTPIDMNQLGYSMKEMDQMTRVGIHTDRIMSIFGIPLAIATTKTNLANIQAALIQYAKFALIPRLTTFCQSITTQLVRRYDDKAFLWYDNPIPEDAAQKMKTRESMLRTKQRTVNEYREEDGLAPVAWGNEPVGVENNFNREETEKRQEDKRNQKEDAKEKEGKKAWWENANVGPTMD